jgi:hypothetical protein
MEDQTAWGMRPRLAKIYALGRQDEEKPKAGLAL